MARIFLCWLLYVAWATGLAGQSVWQFGHVSTSDDFSLNPVTSIVQDAGGRMWYGSGNGLLTYDGQRLDKHLITATDELRRSANRINAIALTADGGDLWLATAGGLYRYALAYDRSSQSSWMPPEELQAVAVVGSQLWAGGSDGVRVYDLREGRLLHHFALEGLGGVTTLVTDGNTGVYVGGQRGLTHLRSALATAAEVKSLPATVNDLLLKGNTVWIATQQGLFRSEGGASPTYVDKDVATYENDYIRSLTVDRSGRLWVGTYAGLYVGREGSFEHLRHQPAGTNSLADDKIRALYQDRSGTVWIASYFGGLNTWNALDFHFSTIDEANGNRLGDHVVSAIAEGADGELYFGTSSKGITILEAGTATYRHFSEVSEGREIGTVRCLLYQDRQNLWVGTFQQGLLHFNPQTGRGTRYLYDDRKSLVEGNNGILSLTLHRGTVLVGTSGGQLKRFDPDRSRFTDLLLPNAETVEPWGAVRSLLPTGDSLLVGTSSGVYRWSPHSKQLQPLTASRIFVEDMVHAAGHTWVATIDKGLYRLDQDSLLSVALPDASTVYSLVAAGDSTLWMSTEQGLISYRTGSGKSEGYDRRSGLTPNAFQRAAGLRAGDGRYYFGGASGVTVFDPATLGQTDAYAPSVLLTRLEVLGHEVTAGDESGVLDRAIAYTARVDLDHDQERIKLGFVMPNFVRNADNIYRYRLRGLEEEWTQSNQPSVTYNLRPGVAYTFEVSGVNSDGRSNGHVTRLEITVGPTPWRSWWAYGGYGLLLTIFGLAAMRVYRSRRRLQRRVALETQERELQREINRRQETFFTNISHELRTPLTLIAGNLERSLTDYRGPSTVYRQLIAAKRSGDHLGRLVNSLLRFRKLGNESLPLQAEEQDLNPCLTQVFEAFTTEAESRRIGYHLRLPQTPVRLYFDTTHLERAVYNLCSNAFKYTPDGGQITVDLKPWSTTLDIRVSDSGPGIPPAALEAVFARYARGEAPESRFGPSSGLGLGIAREAVEAHGGTLEVVSTLGQGSTFVISLPRGTGHLRRPPTPVADDVRIANLADTDRPQVLLAEDNQEVATLLREVLGTTYRVHHAEDGAAALDLAIALQPDLIVSDVMMPGLDGVALCERLSEHERTRGIPILLLTARAAEAQRLAGLQAGAIDYLTKPVSMAELLQRCHNILALRGSQAAATGTLSAASPDELLVQQALTHLDDQVGNGDFQLQQLTESIGVSRSALFAKFRAHTGMAPNEYLLKSRMDAAALLLEQQLTASEVGYRVGYRDPSYFSRSFKKYFGETPRAYARKYVVKPDDTGK